jgi:hypothetical protein
MGWINLSNDPLMSLLKQTGYNTVRLPRESIEPLQLYSRKGNQLTFLGSLSEAFVSKRNVSLPTIQRDKSVSKIDGKRSGQLNLAIGISLLSGILEGLGGSAIGLSEHFKNAKSVTFEYNNVKEDLIDLVQLDRFLNDCDIDPLSKVIGKMLDADEIRVTTSTIKSNKFSIIPTSASESQFKADIPNVKKTVGAKVKVSSSSNDSTKITFEGEKPLVFGFKVLRLFYDKGMLTKIEPEKDVMLGSADTVVTDNAFGVDLIQP